MAESIQIILPRAVYFDANALIAAPNTLAAQPIAEIVHMSKILGAGLFVPQLAAEEWLAKCCADALKAMRRIERDAKQIGTLLDRQPLQCEQISDCNLRRTVRATQARRLIQIGFQTVPTPQVDVEQLISLCLDKVPPFSDGDKGFKDAIILETIYQHACRDQNLDHVVIVSSDKIFGHPAISSRFQEAGTTSHVVGGAPQDLLPHTVEKLKTMLDHAQMAAVSREAERSTTFAKQHESEILQFVGKNATISMSILRGYGLAQYGREKDANDEKFKYARIVSINGMRPLFVASAFASGHLPRRPADGRLSFGITVQVEIDLTIAYPNYFAEPTVPMEDASALLEDYRRWSAPEIEESMTVKRNLQVSASVISEGSDSDEFRDLRLERA